MKKFEVGQVYMMRSPGDHNCIWLYKVMKRTEKTITIFDGKEIKNCRISKYDVKEETVYPLGKYSLCPILRAENRVEMSVEHIVEMEA